jgi:hypothetical protein
MTKERWIFLAIAVALLLTWGSRERTHIKVEETLTLKLTESETKSKSLSDKLETTVKERDLAVTEVETHNTDGSWTRTKVLLDKTKESIVTSLKTENLTLTTENTSLRQKVSLYEKTVVKSAPMWNALVSVPVLAYADVTQYQIGGGMNLGPISLSVVNPLALKFDPRLQGMIRF